jgi:hypothetical protein
VIPLLAALALASAQPSIPEGRARYRVEIAGTPVGFAELAVSCGRPGCTVSWRSELRLPAASGGVLRRRTIRAHVDRAGRLGEVDAEVDGARRARTGPPQTIPLSLAELVLLARGGGCVDVLDEETGRSGPACAAVDSGGMRIDVLGAVEDVTTGLDGFPEAVDIPGQGTRFVRDPRAEVPAAAPPLEVRVLGPEHGEAPGRFCGRPLDPPPASVDASLLPRPRPDGTSCREQAQAYAAAVRRRGLRARVAVGVAHDGAGFVWHAWAEVRTHGGWVAVDPAFGQLPAEGPRFTIARHGGDAASLAEAGRRILACWGGGRVE